MTSAPIRDPLADHLRLGKVFTKLDITSRTQLGRVLSSR
jgi:hypothetical protein